MVELMAIRYSQQGVRATEDIDILANSRMRPSLTEKISVRLLDLDFELINQTITGNRTTGFRFEKDGVMIDVLGPDGLNESSPPKTIGSSETVAIPGGTKALNDVEKVEIKIDGTRSGTINVPMLPAAIILKACSIVKQDRDQDRQDLVVLLSCVRDPITIRAMFSRQELKHIRKAADPLEIESDDLLGIFPSGQLAEARAAFRLITAS